MSSQDLEWIRTCPLTQFDPQHARRPTCTHHVQFISTSKKKKDVQIAGWWANTTQSTINASRSVLSNWLAPPKPAQASKTAAYRLCLSATGFSCSSDGGDEDAGGPVGFDAASLVSEAVSASQRTAFRSCGLFVTADASTPVVARRMSEKVVCTARYTNTEPNATLQIHDTTDFTNGFPTESV